MLFFLFSPAHAVFIDCNDQYMTLCQKAKSGDPIA
ncbi:hypothetical protein M2263_000916 [Providencia alcalifaciens]|nr:hypothetical protein [Providencia alcalifaciens]